MVNNQRHNNINMENSQSKNNIIENDTNLNLNKEIQLDSVSLKSDNENLLSEETQNIENKNNGFQNQTMSMENTNISNSISPPLKRPRTSNNDDNIKKYNLRSNNPIYPNVYDPPSPPNINKSIPEKYYDENYYYPPPYMQENYYYPQIQSFQHSNLPPTNVKNTHDDYGKFPFIKFCSFFQHGHYCSPCHVVHMMMHKHRFYCGIQKCDIDSNLYPPQEPYLPQHSFLSNQYPYPYSQNSYNEYYSYPNDGYFNDSAKVRH